MSSDLIVSPLRGNNLTDVAAIHLSAFPDGAITLLGCEAARRYYDWQLNGPHKCAAIGAFKGDKLLGFCFGGTFNGALSGFLRENRLFLVRQVLIHPRLLTSPFFRQRLRFGLQVLRRFKPRKKKSASQQPNQPRQSSFGILSIGVDQSAQGLGVGRLLMGEAERLAREAGFPQMHLTVHPDNHQAIGFYEHLCWQKISGEADGVWGGRMIKELT